MKVLEALATAIAAEGIDHVFAVMGDANQDIIVELCEKHGLTYVHAHHEGSAVAMADGYSRLTGKIGLCTTTQGPGYANATHSLVHTRLHRSPVLMLAGHASLRDPYNPQGMLDQHALALLTAGATVKIEHPDSVDYCLGEAFRQIKAKKGPFILNMPQDIQHAALSDKNWTYRPMYKAKTLQPPRPDDVAEAVAILAAAKRPSILCGLGAAQGKSEAEVQKLAEYLGAPVTTTLYAAGFCRDYSLHLGISGGLGSDLAVDTLAESDAMIVVGASLNEWTTHFGKILENGKKIIQIDDREDAFGWFARITVGLEADAKAAVVALLDKLKEGGKAGRQPDAKLVQKKQQQKPPAITYDDGKSVDPRRAARYLEDKLPNRDRILVFDGGHALMVAVQTLTSSGADNWSTGADFGAVGQGLGIALGACFARPGKRITHVTADASFMMNVADFHTAVSHNLPLTVFVFNDNAVGQERHDLVHKGFPTKYAEIAQPDFEKLAVGFGAKGFRVNTPDDFGEIDKALAVQDGPVIVNIRINGDVELPVSWEIAQHLENTGE
jgi:acetolactate synthase I/II/III large subunit